MSRIERTENRWCIEIKGFEDFNGMKEFHILYTRIKSVSKLVVKWDVLNQDNESREIFDDDEI